MLVTNSGFSKTHKIGIIGNWQYWIAFGSKFIVLVNHNGTAKIDNIDIHANSTHKTECSMT